MFLIYFRSIISKTSCSLFNPLLSPLSGTNPFFGWLQNQNIVRSESNKKDTVKFRPTACDCWVSDSFFHMWHLIWIFCNVCKIEIARSESKKKETIKSRPTACTEDHTTVEWGTGFFHVWHHWWQIYVTATGICLRGIISLLSLMHKVCKLNVLSTLYCIISLSVTLRLWNATVTFL